MILTHNEIVDRINILQNQLQPLGFPSISTFEDGEFLCIDNMVHIGINRYTGNYNIFYYPRDRKTLKDPYSYDVYGAPNIMTTIKHCCRYFFENEQRNYNY